MGLLGSLLRTAAHSAVATGAGTLVARGMNGSGGGYGSQAPLIREGADTLYFNEHLHPSQRIFGVPGASLYFANLDEDALNAGIRGEQVVAKKLDELTEANSNLYVFHSVKIPGHLGDIDHVLVQGNVVILVDSKNWKHDATYEVHTSGVLGEEDVVLRDGLEFAGGTIGLQRQTGDWVQSIPDYYRVYSALVVSNTKSTIVDHRSSDKPYTFINLGDLEPFVNSLLHRERNGYEANPLPYLELQRFATRTQNPNFDPNDMNNYVYPNGMPYVTENQPAPVAQPTVKASATGLSIGITIWSILNWLLVPLIYAIIPLTAGPLLFVAHRHLAKAKREGLGGQGLTLTSIIFTYALLGVWVVFILLYFAAKLLYSS
jgi:hypothetical protein